MRQLLAILVALAAVLGITWYFAFGRAPSTPRGIAPAAAPEARPLSAVEEDELDVADEPAPSTERAVQETVAPAAAAASSDASASRETAESVLTGRVTDPRGEPIADAELRLGGTDFQFFRRRGDARPAVEARTDAEGRFRLATRQRGAVRIGVEAARYAPHAVDVVVHGASEQALGDIALSRGVVLAGRVVDRLGAAVAGAEIRRPVDTDGGMFFVMPGRAGDLLTTTDEQGRFEVDRQAVGPWTLVVASEDHPDATLRGETRSPGEEQRDLIVTLEHGATIAGRVTGAPEGAGADLRVRAVEDRGGVMEIDFFDVAAASSMRAAEPADDGTFVVRGLQAGKSYRLSLVEGEGFFGSSRSGPVSARAGDVGVEVAYVPGTALAFQVVDAKTGAPIPRFTVEAGVDWVQPLQDESGQPLAEHADGRARYEGLRPRGATNEARLVIDAVGYERYEQSGIEIDGRGEVDLGRIALAPMPVVRVLVRAQKTGEPIAHARVELNIVEREQPGTFTRRVSASIGGGHVFTGDGGSSSARTDENGIALVRSAPGRLAEVTVAADGYARWKSGEIALPAESDHEVDVLLTAGGSVRIVARDASGAPMPGIGIRHRADGEQRGMTFGIGGGVSGDETADAEGTALFEHLAPGRHLFQLVEQRPASGGAMFVMSIDQEEDDSGWTEGWVKEGETTELVLLARARGALHGTISEGGAPLVAAQLRLEEAGAAERGMPMFPGMNGGPSARTDGDGRYRFDDVAAGAYELVVEHDDRAMDERFEVEVEEGDNELDLALSVAMVEGRVLDEAGEPVAGARVRVERSAPSGRTVRFAMRMVAGDEDGATVIDGSGRPRVATTDAEGRYTLRGVASDCDLRLDVSHPEYQPGRSEVFRVAADEVKRDQDVTLVSAGRIEVTVRAADGTPAAMVMVQARYAGESDSPVDPAFEMSNREGKAVLKSLRAGPWDVTVQRPRAPAPGEVPDEPEPHRVEVKAGEMTPITLDVL